MKNDNYDVIVAGGGAAGTYAALGAANRRARVLLIEKNPVLGGQGTVTGERGFCGDVLHVNRPFREVFEILRGLDAVDDVVCTKDGVGYHGETLAYVLGEKVLAAGIDVRLHTTLAAAEVSDGRITSALLVDKSGLHRVSAPVFVDCSGDGDLVEFAGFRTEKGGPVVNADLTIKPDTRLQLPMSLCFYMEDIHRTIRPHLPEGCQQWASDSEIPMTSISFVTPNTVFVKMKVIGGDATDPISYSLAEFRSRKQMMQLVHYLQTHGYRDRVYDTFRLSYVSAGLGIREGRRIIGDYALTVDDVRHGRHFADAVAVGSYQIDYHWPDVLQRAGTGIRDQVPPYQIPYRALIPADGRNVLVAGRTLAGEHLAMSSSRVMTTCAQTGFAAGIAAALSLDDNGDVRRVDISHLQSILSAEEQVLNTSVYRRYRRQRRAVLETLPPDQSGLESPALCELSGSSTLLAWIDETAEHARCLKTRVRHEERWAEPSVVTAVGDGVRLIVGVVEQPSGTLNIVVFGASGGGQLVGGLVVSADRGHTWTFGDASKSGLVLDGSERPATLLAGSHGVWILPVLPGSSDPRAVRVLFSEDEGQSWVESDIADLGGIRSNTLDPEYGVATSAIAWESGDTSLHVLIGLGRSVGYRLTSTDGGRSWRSSVPDRLEVFAGPYSDYVGAVGLEGRDVALACRTENGLSLLISHDDGNTWPDRCVMEHLPGSGLRIPAAMARSPEGISLVTQSDGTETRFVRESIESLMARCAAERERTRPHQESQT